MIPPFYPKWEKHRPKIRSHPNHHPNGHNHILYHSSLLFTHSGSLGIVTQSEPQFQNGNGPTSCVGINYIMGMHRKNNGYIGFPHINRHWESLSSN